MDRQPESGGSGLSKMDRIVGGSAAVDDPAACLAATEFTESDAPAIRELAASLRGPTPQATAVALFDWVRDRIRYDPKAAVDERDAYRATRVLARGSGYCVQKAILLAALARAAGIPARLGFADVRNHQSPAWLREVMGTDVFVFHGYVEFLLGGRWVKATPAFDEASSRKAGVLPVTLDGTNDAMLHPVDPRGHPYIEYLRDRGSYLDAPVDEIRREIAERYAVGRWAP
ncbi:MAG: transglutaminase domain-containing protein [Deltaproteobacteria bacterium]|nr:transglutaminase domain-containing protein [Deltaproteobacteria bacterium]